MRGVDLFSTEKYWPCTIPKSINLILNVTRDVIIKQSSHVIPASSTGNGKVRQLQIILGFLVQKLYRSGKLRRSKNCERRPCKS